MTGYHTLCMDEGNADEGKGVWKRVMDELERRARKHLKPASWPELYKAIALEKNTAWNWKKRASIPRASFQIIADTLGWTLDQLLGRDVSTTHSGNSAQIHRLVESLTPPLGVHISGTLDTPEARLLVQLLEAVTLPGVVVEVIWTDDPSKQRERAADLLKAAGFTVIAPGTEPPKKRARTKRLGRL